MKFPLIKTLLAELAFKNPVSHCAAETELTRPSAVICESVIDPATESLLSDTPLLFLSLSVISTPKSPGIFNLPLPLMEILEAQGVCREEPVHCVAVRFFR